MVTIAQFNFSLNTKLGGGTKSLKPVKCLNRVQNFSEYLALFLTSILSKNTFQFSLQNI